MLTKTRLLSLALLMPLFAACSGGPAEPDDPADDIAFMRLVIGTQTLTIDEGGAISGGPVVIPATGATITATFLDMGMQPVALGTEFRLDVADSGGRVTFARTSAFSGTLNRVSAGTTTLVVSLFHIPEGHADISRNIPVTVQ